MDHVGECGGGVEGSGGVFVEGGVVWGCGGVSEGGWVRRVRGGGGEGWNREMQMWCRVVV